MTFSAAADAKVIVNYAGGKDAAEEVISQIIKDGREAIALQADVSKSEDMKTFSMLA